MRASINNPFGKGSLINLLRQFSKLHKERKQVSVGLIGYPNVGKSSIINCLRGKKVATIAPIPGETKVWQYVTLMKRIYLIDCPGIVPQNHQDSPSELLLRGVVRVENVEHPEQYIPLVLKRVKKHHMARTYNLSDWKDDHIEFLEVLARKGGRLLKGGEPDVDGVAKMVLNDFMRGKIPWFIPPPVAEGEKDEATPVKAAPKKRKRDAVEAAEKAAEEEESGDDDSSPDMDAQAFDETFHGFDSDSAPEISDDSDSEIAEEDVPARVEAKKEPIATEAPEEEPDVEDGGAPVAEEPEVEAPVAKKPAAKKAATKKAAPKKGAAKKPVVEEPVDEEPVVEEPVVEEPVVEEPAVEEPVTKKPATKKAAAKKPVTKKAAVKKAVVEEPEVKEAEVEEPVVEQPVAKKATSKKAATKTATPKKAAAKKPVVEEAEVEEPDVEEPVAKKPVGKKAATKVATPKKAVAKKVEVEEPAAEDATPARRSKRLRKE